MFRGAALAMLLAITACSLSDMFGEEEEQGLVFNHQVHADEGLECADCHMGVTDSDEPGMPGLDGCMLCHESMQDEETPAEERVETMFDAEGRMKAKSLSRLADETIFSHLGHVNAELECSACHGQVEVATSIDEAVVVSMDDCMDCHGERAVANACTTCHTEYDIAKAPHTHDHNWDKLHGRVVRAHTEGLVNDCSLCHTEATCTSCHRDEQPESHTNYFRLRGHGIQASIDRESCWACHRAESCDRCHSSTTPLSHTGSWGGSRSTHCVGCHEPLRSSSCYTCHKATPSHRMATPKPPGHVASMNCRLCHGMGAPLPHVDNGSDCNSCHR
jgi:hypothetical protein